jgi:hypothetical protein
MWADVNEKAFKIPSRVAGRNEVLSYTPPIIDGCFDADNPGLVTGINGLGQIALLPNLTKCYGPEAKAQRLFQWYLHSLGESWPTPEFRYGSNESFATAVASVGPCRNSDRISCKVDLVSFIDPPPGTATANWLRPASRSAAQNLLFYEIKQLYKFNTFDDPYLQLNAYIDFFGRNLNKSVKKGAVPFFSMFTHRSAVYMAYSYNAAVAGPGLEGVIAVQKVNINKCLTSLVPAAQAMRSQCQKLKDAANLGQVVSIVTNVGPLQKAAIWKSANIGAQYSPEEASAMLGFWIVAGYTSRTVLTWEREVLEATFESGPQAGTKAAQFTRKEIIDAIQGAPVREVPDA